MAIYVTCGACGRAASVDDSMGGRTFTCNGCRAAVEVPGRGAAMPPVLPPDATPTGQTPEQRAKRRRRAWLWVGGGVLVLPFVVVGVAVVVFIGAFIYVDWKRKIERDGPHLSPSNAPQTPVRIIPVPPGGFRPAPTTVPVFRIGPTSRGTDGG